MMYNDFRLVNNTKNKNTKTFSNIKMKTPQYLLYKFLGSQLYILEVYYYIPGKLFTWKLHIK